MKDCFGHEIPESAYIVRATEVSEFLNCPLKWSVMSHNGLNLEPVTSNQKLRLGTIWHKALEWYYNPQGPSTEDVDRYGYAMQGMRIALAKDKADLEKELGEDFYSPEAVAARQEEETLLQVLFDGYYEWSDNPELCPHPDRDYEFLATEKRFLVPILTPTGRRSQAYLAVKLDAISAKGDFIWGWEHKTRGKSMSVSNPDNMDLDLQMGLQLLALHKALQGHKSHVAVRGAVYNLTRKQMPGPRVKSPIYGRHEVTRSTVALERLEVFLHKTYLDMREASRAVASGSLPWKYNPQPWAGVCTWGCPAKHICRGQAEGDDTDYLLSVYFKPRSKDIWQVLEEEMSDQE